MTVLNDRKLIHCQPVIVVKVREIYEPGLVIDNPSIPSIFNRYSIHQIAMKTAVVFNEAWMFSPYHLSYRLFPGFLRNIRIDLGQGRPEAAYKNNLSITFSLCKQFARGDVRAKEKGVAQLAKPGEGGGFEVGFGYEGLWHFIKSLWKSPDIVL
jgi:hypothetical protein